MTYRGAGCGKATCPVLRGAWVATDALGSPMVELGTHSATERAELDTLHLPESVHREHPAYSTWAAKRVEPATQFRTRRQSCSQSSLRSVPPGDHSPLRRRWLAAL